MHDLQLKYYLRFSIIDCTLRLYNQTYFLVIQKWKWIFPYGTLFCVGFALLLRLVSIPPHYIKRGKYPIVILNQSVSCFTQVYTYYILIIFWARKEIYFSKRSRYIMTKMLCLLLLKSVSTMVQIKDAFYPFESVVRQRLLSSVRLHYHYVYSN